MAETKPVSGVTHQPGGHTAPAVLVIQVEVADIGHSGRTRVPFGMLEDVGFDRGHRFPVEVSRQACAVDPEQPRYERWLAETLAGQLLP